MIQVSSASCVAIICNGKFHHFQQAKELQDLSRLHYIISTYPYFIAKKYGIERGKFVSMWYLEIVKRSFRFLFNKEIPFKLYSIIFNYCAILHVLSRKPSRYYLLQAGYCLDLLLFLKLFSKKSRIILDRGSLHTDKDYELRALARKDAGHMLKSFKAIDYRSFQSRERQEYALVDKIMVPSSFVRKSFSENSNVFNKCFVNPFPPSFPNIAQSEVPSILDFSCFNVLFVGQKSTRKGFHSLIRAFEDLHSLNLRIKLIAIGAAADLNIQDAPWLISIDSMPNHQLAGFYRHCNVFCLPSYAEGLPLVLCEASAFSLHIITTSNTGVEDLLPTSSFDLVGNPGDFKSISKCIQNLYFSQQGNSSICLQKSCSETTIYPPFFNKNWGEYSLKLINEFTDFSV